MAETANDSGSSAELKKEEGNIAYKAKKYQEAIDLYGDAIALDPKNSVFYTNRAAAYLALKKPQEAKNDCEECIKLDPESVKAHLRLATALLALKNYTDALEIATKGVVICSQNKKGGQASFRSLISDIKSKMPRKNNKSGRDGMNFNMEEFRELSMAYQDATMNHQKASHEVNFKTREKRRNEICMNELKDIQEKSKNADPINAYKSIGRMFYKSNIENINVDLTKENKVYETQIQSAENAKRRFGEKIDTLKKRLQNIAPRQ